MNLNDITNDAYKDELLNLEPAEVDVNAIKNKVFEKLDISQSEDQNGNAERHSSMPIIQRGSNKKSRRRTFRTVAIVAAAMIGCTSIVYATSEFLKMSKQDIDYFDKNGSGTTEVNSSTYLAGLEEAVEEFNATIGESMTENGRTVTFDSVSVDDNFINGFFTIIYDSPIDLNVNVDEFYPAYSKLKSEVPMLTIKIDGRYVEDLLGSLDQYDPYMLDEKTVKMMVRWGIPRELPDTFSLSVGTYSYFENYDDSIDGKYHFDISIDKTAASVYTRAAEAKTYSFETTDGTKTLELSKLAITPFGTILSATSALVYTASENPDPYIAKLESTVEVDPSKVDPSRLYITDDKGNVINALYSNPRNIGLSTLELIGVAPDTKSLTLAPVIYEDPQMIYEDPQIDTDGYLSGHEGLEKRTYSVNDIGTKIELNNLGGYYLEDYKIEGCRISLVLRPYGKCDYMTGSIVINGENVSLIDDDRSGLINEQLDRNTGLLTYSIDYYAATTEELKSISTFTVQYENVGTIDESAAITIPLNTINK